MKCGDSHYRLSLTWSLQSSGIIRDKAFWLPVNDESRHTDFGVESVRGSTRTGSILDINVAELYFSINARKHFIQGLEFWGKDK